MKSAGLIFDASWHYLDHLAPLSALLRWPLILSDPDLLEAAHIFYPDLTLIEIDSLNVGKWIREEVDRLVTCMPRPLLEAAIGLPLPATLWLPHGQSDKGHIAPYFEALKEDPLALIYGEQMETILKQANLTLPTLRIGHFRSLYYQKMRSFYDSLSLPLSFRAAQPTLLYAPTWEDVENNCSFWNAFPILSERLPSHLNLLVKLHPNTILQHRPRIERLMGQSERGNLRFLLEFVPILPLLERCDAYLGDRSSIGYDFLLFDRPLFFLNPHESPKGRDLLDCGRTLRPEEVFDVDWEQDRIAFSLARKRRAAYAFDTISLETLREILQ